MANKRISFNNKNLKDKIVGCHFTFAEIAEKLGISLCCLYNKLNDHTYFKADEILIISDVLNVSDPEEFRSLFFTQKVQ